MSGAELPWQFDPSQGTFGFFGSSMHAVPGEQLRAEALASASVVAALVAPAPATHGITARCSAGELVL